MTEIEVTITQPVIEVKFESTLNTGGGGAVDSVNGQTGDVVLTTTNINEGTNQYFTDARAIAALAATLASYVTTSALNAALSAYVTTVSLASTLANYVTSSSLATTLSNYVTNSSLATTLSSYATTSQLADKQDKRIVVSSNTTAVVDGAYTLVATSTFTDPSPVEGKGFSVLIRNGTATIGGTTYSTAGTTVWRVFHSGAWANYVNQLGLGFTAENVANKTTDINGAAATYPDTPTVKAYADLLGTRAVIASNTVAFDNPKQFGSVASPRTGALLVDYTGARNGLVALVYHNDTTLSIPVSWTNISAISYTASQTNVICVAFIGNSKAVLTILGVV